jgi:hypothetical protein
MGRDQPSLHLSDAEIDAYWAGRLSGTDERRVELHYLECAPCRDRAAAVDALVEALRLGPAPVAPPARGLGAWQLAAAVFAVVAVGATWQWARLARDAGPAPAVTEPEGTALAALRVALQPPTRSAAATEVALSPAVGVVVFDLDTREAAAPGALLDVALIGPAGGVQLRTSGPSSAAGRFELAVHRSLLPPGRFRFDVTCEGATIALPVVIHHSAQQP